jgi:hypothetical protein
MATQNKRNQKHNNILNKNNMNQKEVKIKLITFLDDFEEIQTVSVIEDNIGQSLGKNIKAEIEQYGLNNDWIENYQNLFGFQLQWKAKLETGIDANGSIKIMELPIVFSDWKGQTYFDNTPEDDMCRDFKIVDFYFDEYASGILFGKNKDFTFYNAELDGTQPKSLDLDINGYIEMMMISKGYAHWQLVIEHLLYKEYHKEHTERFKENMPKLFPDWTWEGFIKKFEEVRLKKVK